MIRGRAGKSGSRKKTGRLECAVDRLLVEGPCAILRCLCASGTVLARASAAYACHTPGAKPPLDRGEPGDLNAPFVRCGDARTGDAWSTSLSLNLENVSVRYSSLSMLPFLHCSQLDIRDGAAS